MWWKKVGADNILEQNYAHAIWQSQRTHSIYPQWGGSWNSHMTYMSGNSIDKLQTALVNKINQKK